MYLPGIYLVNHTLPGKVRKESEVRTHLYLITSGKSEGRRLLKEARRAHRTLVNVHARFAASEGICESDNCKARPCLLSMQIERLGRSIEAMRGSR